MENYVVKVYEEVNGIVCLFRVIEFQAKESAINYAQAMIEKGFAVETYQRIVF